MSIGMTGFEPATSTSRTCESRVPSGNPSEVASSGSGVCTSVCTSETRKTRRSRSKVIPAVAPEAVTNAPAGDFAAALAMIATLPLSDVEKSEAVRRLLTAKERHG